MPPLADPQGVYTTRDFLRIVLGVVHEQDFIEQDLQWLKDRLLIPITPIWHRKDGNIRVHMFLCVQGLFFVRYLSWKVGDQGITDERMMDELARIRVALVSRSDLKKPQLVVEEMTPLQARLFTKLDLSRYIKLNNF